MIWSDDGIIFRFPDVDTPPSTSEILVEPDEIESLVLEEAADSALFTSRFREAAARALLLPRRRPGSRTPLWLQRRKAASLLEITRNYGSFPIILETYREVLQDHFDIPSLREVLGDIQRRKISVAEVQLDGPSPFATSLTFDFIASFMYEYDAPTAEKRATALTLDRSLLRELLGEPEFRELLDRDVVADVELELQRLVPDRRIASADQLHDALRDLGPLSRAEISARSKDAKSSSAWEVDLKEGHRIVEVTAHGEVLLAAIEDVGRLRDALGITPPQGIPLPYLDPVEDPLGDVISRYARTHGPFGPNDAGARLGLPVGVVEEVLKRLESDGRVASGAYRPGGSGQEWVDLDVLRRLRRRSLAVLRKEVEAVDAEAYGRFLPSWQGVGNRASGPDRLLEVIRQLQGVSMPAGSLETEILPARMSYEPGRLDDLLASGEVVWIGRGPLGPRNGRVSLYLREQVPLLHDPEVDLVEGAVQESLRNHLRDRGASFFRDLYLAAEGGDPQVILESLWDLVWAGEVTNDTLAPLRALAWRKARRSGRHSRLPTATPPAGSGRWYLVSDLHDGVPALGEERARARADQLLNRYGVVTRDAVLAEGIAGGFAGLYPVFAAMEDAGRVRRGYFVEGLGGAQFGLPGAIDRVRTTEGTTITISATDPANPYGATLSWPSTTTGRPARRAGSHVILIDGSLAAYVERGGRTISTLDGHHTSDQIAEELTLLAQRRFRRMTIETIDGEAAGQTALGSALLTRSFVQGYKGITFREATAKRRGRH